MEKQPISISDLHQLLSQVFDNILGEVFLEGEIGQFKFSPSGHCYLTLKDSKSSIDCVIFKGKLKKNTPLKIGDKILCRGNIATYPPSGKIQFIVNSYDKSGLGLLFQQFLAMKNKLEQEGLFSPDRKKKIPEYPKAIGLITSTSGAVLRDFVSVVKRRYPSLKVFVFPATVQGRQAPEELITALTHALNFSKDVIALDCVVMMRGGGSFEDLFCFNDETLARKMAEYPLPIISAIGHETDFTISDFVADLRAATPSVAAEIVSSYHQQVLVRFKKLVETVDYIILSKVRNLKNTLQLMKNIFVSPAQKIQLISQRLDDYILRFEKIMKQKVVILKNKLELNSRLVTAVNPEHVLKRGYSIVFRENEIVDSRLKISKKNSLVLQFHDGRIEGTFDAN